MKPKKRLINRIIRQCAALYRRSLYYRKRVRMIEHELGGRMGTC